MAIHARVFGSTEPGRDAAEAGASECIVGILIRLGLCKDHCYCSLLSMPVCGQQTSLREDLGPLCLSEVPFDREETAQLQQHVNTL